MVANSNFVRARIRHIYGRDADVVFPPVDVAERHYQRDKDDYFVTASFLAPYKRTDLVIEAFNAMPSRRLVVVGEGQQSKKLRAMAGPNVHFAGYLQRDDYAATIARAQALVFAGCEDFGIALAEAQAWGTPLIAFARGGAADIVRPLGRMDRPTGLLFSRQTAAAVQEAVEHFAASRDRISPAACRQNALRFSTERFHREIARAFERTLALHGMD
jgi:glycosyltransferase involved in cell wall biosynthesis